jgi:hypothetical protein
MLLAELIRPSQSSRLDVRDSTRMKDMRYAHARGCYTAGIWSVEVHANGLPLSWCANASWRFFVLVRPFSKSLPSVQIQAIKCVPGIWCLLTVSSSQIFQSQSRALCLSVPIALRMSGKSEENILKNPWRQVDQFWPPELDLRRKIADVNRVNEMFEATDALQLNVDSQYSGDNQPDAGDSGIEGIFHLTDRFNRALVDVQKICCFFAFEVNPFRRNLLQVYIHGFNLCPKIYPP